VEQREGRRRWKECLFRQVQHHRRILADGIEHHRLFGLGHHLAHDVDGFGFETVEMGQAGFVDHLGHGTRRLVITNGFGQPLSPRRSENGADGGERGEREGAPPPAMPGKWQRGRRLAT